MNEQRFFDAALDHIRQQGEPSVKINAPLGDDDFSISAFCVYDGPDDKRCAFGPAILKFDPEMEGEAADAYPKQNLHEWARDLDKVLVGNVQSAHDCSCRLTGEAFVNSFNEKMERVVLDYNKEYPTAPIVYRAAA